MEDQTGGAEGLKQARAGSQTMRSRQGSGSKEFSSEQQDARISPRSVRQGSGGGSGRPPLPGKLGQKSGLSEKLPLSIIIPSDEPQQQAMAALIAPKLEIASTHNMLAELTVGYSAEALFGPAPPATAGAGSSSAAEFGMSPHWATNLLMECAKAMVGNHSARVQHIMWVLNELASPYGDCDQRLASYMLQALFCKVTGTGARCYHILCSTAARTYCFDSMRKMILKFQEASPWTTFGHVAANGTLMEAFEGEMHVHIVDVSNTFCTQWPTLLESLATRPAGAPHLRLTTVIGSAEESAMKVMRQIGGRLEKFARLMGVPFEFAVLQQPQLEKLDPSSLNLRSGEALAINCIQILHEVSPHSAGLEEASPRDTLFTTMRSMGPKIVTLVEHEVDLSSSAVNFHIARGPSEEASHPEGRGVSLDPTDSEHPGSLLGFSEALHFYSLLFDSLEDSLPRVSNERLLIERNSGRAMVSMVACDDTERSFWQEKGRQWGARLRAAGFAVFPFNYDVVDDVRALLKRYREGWDLAAGQESTESCSLYLTWKKEHVVFASAWKPV